MPLSSLAQLSNEARAALERYLGDVDAVLRPLDSDAADATREDLLGHAFEALDQSATVDDVRALTDHLGEPATYSAGLREAISGGAEDTVGDDSAPQGRLLGMPYDLRVPTTDRVASRLWNPRDRRVIMPRVFGLGWTVNFGAIAVRLGLLEPDAEDAPFAAVPDRVFWTALFVPVGITAIVLGSYLALRPHLPAMLPTHWGLLGVANGYSRQGPAFAAIVALALLPSLAAMVVVALRRARPTQGLVIGLATFFSALAAGIWTLAVATVFGLPPTPWLPFVLLLAPPLLLTLAVFVALARAGRAAEQRRDLGG